MCFSLATKALAVFLNGSFGLWIQPVDADYSGVPFHPFREAIQGHRLMIEGGARPSYQHGNGGDHPIHRAGMIAPPSHYRHRPGACLAWQAGRSKPAESGLGIIFHGGHER